MELVAKIKELKKKKNAVILAHNYQISEVQDIADFVGDSLGLSLQASKTGADIIVFCGVYFMAETAKIISPEKTVLIPDRNAGCPMADMITAEGLRKLKKEHPRAKVMCYVNTPAEVKAECDICCTSANAVEITNGPLMDEDGIIFVPDKYLTNYVAGQTGKRFIYWHGYCPSHIKITTRSISEKKYLYPRAEVIVHPECTPDVIQLADKVLSTEGMCKYAKMSEAEEFIVGTEAGMVYRLSKENPEKKFYPAAEEAVCPNMKLITPEKILRALERTEHEVTLPGNVIERARGSIKNMLDFAEVSV